MKKALIIIGILSLAACAKRKTVYITETGCSVTQEANGATLTCGTATVFIANGQNGLDGQDGVDGQDGIDGQNGQDAQVEIFDPCGDGPGHDEVILKFNSVLIAYFRNGPYEHLAVLQNGSYVTTDQQACHFSVNNGTIL